MYEKKEEQKNNKSICDTIFCKDNLARDIVIVAISIGLSVLLLINHRKLSHKPGPEFLSPPVAENTEEENEAENPILDTTNWKTYQTGWYGFELKYPENWKKPTLKNATKGVKWEYCYELRKSEIDESNPYIGFDVVVYNVNRIKELSNTDEFPTIKNEELKEQGACQEIEGHLAENEDYPAEQIYIPADDDCYNPAYFYTLTRDEYLFNITPILIGEEEVIQSEKEIIKSFPEFISISSTFNLIDIRRPKPQAVARKITAPMPAWYKKDTLGRLVCAKKKDHPGKSKQGKKKHLDMECCLDSDEYPNPHCYYDPAVYGKYL